MKVVNLFSGPGAGKSTAAAYIFARLKSKHIDTELVGEVAKELIYLGNEVQLVNQPKILGCQYGKLVDLKRNKIQVAISDAPLAMQLVYCQDKPYYKEIEAFSRVLNSEFDNINIFIRRCNPYQTYGRVHSEAEALVLDKKIKDFMRDDFHYVIEANDNDLDFLVREIIKLTDKELISEF